MLSHTYKRAALRRAWVAVGSATTRSMHMLNESICRFTFLNAMDQDEDLRSQVVNSLAFSSDEDSFKRFFTPKISQTMEDQLRISHDQLTDFQKPLPSSLNEVKYEKRRAIVVTEMQPPFKIVYVNSAWESLCGWTHPECVGKTLSLLQGKETDLSSVTSLLVKVLHGEEAGVVLTNYTKGQRRFRNHLRVRPMDDNYFVGVLREIHDGA